MKHIGKIEAVGAVQVFGYSARRIDRDLCDPLVMPETTGDRLFRQIANTWLGPVEDDLMDDYDRYTSREEVREGLNKGYLDRLEDI